ncbi:hypothetical protein J6590_024567 [Homalodisca vitripennis]|nr:hypothetical protein J6590_024567 [Homalodisca vitripennis]
MFAIVDTDVEEVVEEFHIKPKPAKSTRWKVIVCADGTHTDRYRILIDWREKTANTGSRHVPVPAIYGVNKAEISMLIVQAHDLLGTRVQGQTTAERVLMLLLLTHALSDSDIVCLVVRSHYITCKIF